MDNKRFEEVIEDQIQQCRDTLITKAKEYAGDEDRLHNFRAAAGLVGGTGQSALGGMMLKHTVSIYDMLKGPDVYTLAQWEEKIGDHLNYLLLLKALLVDNRDQRTTAEDNYTKSKVRDIPSGSYVDL